MKLSKYAPTIKIPPRALAPGDVIVTETWNDSSPKEGLTVTETQHYACSQRNTHINGDSCYAWSVPVEVVT